MTFKTENVKNQLSEKILTNLVSYLEKNITDFPSISEKEISYSYEPEYKIVALWWDNYYKYEDFEEIGDLKEFSSYILDYDSEGMTKGIEIFNFNPDKFEGD